MLKIALAAALATSACGGFTARNAAAYKTDLALYDVWVLQQARLLRMFVASCTCADGKFIDPACAEAAEHVVVVDARRDWHMGMTLYNAGLSDDRPPKEPPIIPPSSCPLPAVTP